jgi:hypothetical protein
MVGRRRIILGTLLLGAFLIPLFHTGFTRKIGSMKKTEGLKKGGMNNDCSDEC